MEPLSLVAIISGQLASSSGWLCIEHRGLLFVCPFVRPPPLIGPLRPQIWAPGPQIWPLRPRIKPLRPQIQPVRPQIQPLRLQIQPLRPLRPLSP